MYLFECPYQIPYQIFDTPQILFDFVSSARGPCSTKKAHLPLVCRLISKISNQNTLPESICSLDLNRLPPMLLMFLGTFESHRTSNKSTKDFAPSLYSRVSKASLESFIESHRVSSKIPTLAVSPTQPPVEVSTLISLQSSIGSELLKLIIRSEAKTALEACLKWLRPPRTTVRHRLRRSAALTACGTCLSHRRLVEHIV